MQSKMAATTTRAIRYEKAEWKWKFGNENFGGPCIKYCIENFGGPCIKYCMGACREKKNCWKSPNVALAPRKNMNVGRDPRKKKYRVGGRRKNQNMRGWRNFSFQPPQDLEY